MNKQTKLKRIISYLKGAEKIRTQKDLADIIDVNHTNLSSALNGNENYLTDRLFSKILEKFPMVEFIIKEDENIAFSIGNGNEFRGNMMVGNGHNINIEDTPSISNSTDVNRELLDIIKKKDEQIDRLLELLSKK